MDSSIKKGVGFGLTSGVITTLGMLIGLSTVSESKTVVLGGILSIAIADAASDAMGMHISEESHERAESKHIWQATISIYLKIYFCCNLFNSYLNTGFRQSSNCGSYMGIFPDWYI